MTTNTLPSPLRPNRASTPALQHVVAGIWGLRHVFVNLYFVRNPAAPTDPWVLVDAGLPGAGDAIERAATSLFGPDNPPAAILLTHGHFDHVGALPRLLRRWPQVVVYAHPLELPYLTGRSAYPPPDPTVGGGAMAAASFLYPRQPLDLGERVLPLPPDHSVPHLPGWQWVPTPGHTPGHVSFFRPSDRVLLAGDAFVTVRAESGLATLTQRQQVSGPPAYFTPDWQQAHASVVRLAGLEPAVAATGHGIPMWGNLLREQLQELARHFKARAVPAHGRYVVQPATADETGVVSVPPAPGSRVPLWVVGATLAGSLLVILRQQNQRRNRQRATEAAASARQPRPLSRT